MHGPIKSNISPIVAEANMPSEPVIAAASSERMSPKRFSVKARQRSRGGIMCAQAST